ncbi:hypothetical protein [Bacteroides sp.]|uniref:hypothetical protein n=1 Tax=Bacteroides sp. TaxID=29523 RepID=UPI0025829615|nr:hypothetical protein [Bacteroides sp.]
MKTKTLLTTCTLAAFLAACNNEDFMTEQTINGPVAENGEVIGADLVSKGMTIYLEEGSADTRAVKGSWKKGDQFGLGWFRFDGKTIVDAQTSAVWNQGAAKWQSDNYIYANHIFTAQEDAADTPWETTTDVYQGGYFAYFPYESLGGVKKKVIEVNKAPQTGTFEEERWNKAFHLSALEYIAAGAGTENNGTLSVSMSPVPMVNTLYTKAIPEANIKNDEILKGMTITSMQINAGGSNNSVFATKATLVPKYIPRRLTTDTNEETRQAMFEAADNSTKTGSNRMLNEITYSSSINTSVDNGSNLDQDREIRAFALPTKNAVTYTTTQYPTVTVTVGRPGKYELGKFAININNSESYIANLKTALSDESNKTCLTKVLRSEAGSWATVKTGMDANLTLASFTLTSSSIQSLEQWNDLVSVCNALKANGYKFTNNEVKFNVTNEVIFDKEETIQVPEGLKVIVSTSSKGQLTIANIVTWPETLVGAANGTAKVVVNNDATLVFDPQNPAEINATITNNGEIHAGALASICTSTLKNLTNNGRVIVEYGAYVYPNSTNGVIAYIVTECTQKEVKHISQLVTSNKKGNANVNTLILRNDVIFDLHAKGEVNSSDDDRYEEGSTTTTYMADLKDINIEMEGASILTTGTNNKVNNIVVKSGNNNITDIQPMGDITVEGGVLNINSDNTPVKSPLYLTYGKTITTKSEGTLKVNTNTYTTYLKNYKPSDIVVAEGYVLYYEGENFLHEGRTEGKIETSTNKQAQSVKTIFEGLSSKQGADLSSEENFLSALNAYVSSNADPNDNQGGYVQFYNVMSDWLVSVGQEGLNKTTGKVALTKAHLALFTQLTGYNFTFGK